jgi:hypothetical protein
MGGKRQWALRSTVILHGKYFKKLRPWGEVSISCSGMRRPTVLTTLFGAMLFAVGGMAEGERLAAPEQMADGEMCQMRLEVVEIRPQMIVGGPVGMDRADAYLKLVDVTEAGNPMCRRAVAAREITMNAVSEQLSDLDLEVGDQLFATVTYRAHMPGKMLYDEYHHGAIVMSYKTGKTSTYMGMGFLP